VRAILAQATEQVHEVAREVASWSAVQTIQVLLVAVLIFVAIGAYFGMKALSESNKAVNANYDKSINLLQTQVTAQREQHAEQLTAQEQRYDKQESRHLERDRQTHEIHKTMAIAIQQIADGIHRLPGNGK
jgi:hypothetical protein